MIIVITISHVARSKFVGMTTSITPVITSRIPLSASTATSHHHLLLHHPHRHRHHDIYHRRHSSSTSLTATTSFLPRPPHYKYHQRASRQAHHDHHDQHDRRRSRRQRPQRPPPTTRPVVVAAVLVPVCSWQLVSRFSWNHRASSLRKQTREAAPIVRSCSCCCWVLSSHLSSGGRDATGTTSMWHISVHAQLTANLP